MPADRRSLPTSLGASGATRQPASRMGIVVAALVVLAACSSTAKADRHPGVTSSTAAPTPTGSVASGPAGPTTTGARPAPGAAASGWPTYHRTGDRAGVGVGTRRPASLHPAWTAAVDGAVFAQPLVVADSVIVATENDSVYALALGTGAIRWKAHLAEPVRQADLPCGNIDPIGITGTPAYDAAHRAIDVVTERAGSVHDLVALDVATGSVRFRRNVDVGGHDRTAQQQRAALAVGGGRVYVAFGGRFGDCGDYIGYVAAVATDGAGPVGRYVVPTTREAGIWAPSGPALAPDGSVYVSIGNGASTSGRYDGSDAVARLRPDLSSRVDVFAPTAWASQNASDLDLGSTGPALVSGGLAVAAGKGGTVYLLDAMRLGGIGGELDSASGCTGFGGAATDRGAVFEPCSEGLSRYDTAGRKLHAVWRVAATGSPTIGGGAVWALDTDAGVLHAYDEATGATLASMRVGPVTRFASPTLTSTMALVGTRDAVVAVAIAG